MQDNIDLVEPAHDQADTVSATSSGFSRRKLVAGAAWSVPAVAVASAAPAYAASEPPPPPCIGSVQSTGGTYPVGITIFNCRTHIDDPTHWDFNFKISAQAEAACDCASVRVRLRNNPNRSRLWLDGRNDTSTADALYVEKELSLGQSGVFPERGDRVYRVNNDNYVGTITAHGTENDSVHTLFTADGDVPCSRSGPMAYYDVTCLDERGREVPNSPATSLNNPANPCIPMIKATVCRHGSRGNRVYRLGISVETSCSLPNSAFKITKVQRNNDTNFPNEGRTVYNGTTTLESGTTDLEVPDSGSGNYFWISFSADGGQNTNILRVRVSDGSCPR